MLKIPALNSNINSQANISLSELQKQYLDKHKKKHNYSSSSTLSVILPLPKFSHQDIKIKSPFYQKICQKINCKCQYHKKQKAPIPKFFNLTNKNFNKIALQKQLKGQNNNNRLSQSMGKGISLLKYIRDSSQFKKQKRYMTLADQNQYERLGIDLEDARNQYEQYLKSQKLKSKGSLDCYNIQFQQFLKSRYMGMLQNFKKPSRKDLYKKNRTYFKKNYMSTQFNESNNDYNNVNVNHNQGDNQNSNYKQKGKRDSRDYSSNSKQNKFKRISKINFDPKKSISGNLLPKNSEFNQLLQKLKEQYFGSFNNGEMQEEKLLSLICKNLLANDPNLIEQTKKFIKRLSQVPLNLFKTLFGEMKQQMQNGIQIPNTSGQDIQIVVNQVIQQVQKNVQDLMRQKKQKKGQQKISILNKIKKEISLGMLLHPHSEPLTKQKTKRSKMFTDPRQFQNWDNITLGQNNHKKIGINNQLDETDQIKNNQAQNFSTFKDKSNSTQMRKPQKSKKKTNQKKIIQEIQSQIQKANQVRKPMQTKTFVQPEELAYQKRRAQSRRRLREEESKNHRQFIQMMRQKQLQRQSSTLSEYQSHKNTMKSHFQRNKIFLKKMQVSLGNSQLKSVVINLQDDVLTKKRKMRLLQNMIEVDQVRGTEFQQDIRKYIDIYQKNCMLATKEKGKQKTNTSSRYTRRVFSKDKYFDYQILDKKDQKCQQEIQLMELLKIDDQLKFYLLNFITCQGQQDPDNFTIKIPQYVTQKQASLKRRNNKNWYLLGKQQKISEETQSDSEVLGQIGMNNKFHQQRKAHPRTVTEHEQIQTKKSVQVAKKLAQNKKFIQKLTYNKQQYEISPLESRFNKKMKQYRKIFKTCGNQ